MKNIIIYGAGWCGDCTRSKAYFDELGVAYDYINIEENDAGLTTTLKLNDGQRIIPTIVYPDGSHQAEPSNEQIKSKLVALKRISD